MTRRFTRALALSVSLSLLTASSSGCFGSFKLVRGIYGFNKDVSNNKMLRWLVFLGLVIIPVYAVGSLGDALIFNTIEFWGGGELAEVGEVRTVALSEHEQLQLVREEGRIRAELTRDGKLVATFFCESTEGGLVVSDLSGERLGRISDAPEQGAVEVRDAFDRVHKVSAEEAERAVLAVVR